MTNLIITFFIDQFAEKHGMVFFETSCLTSTNVTEVSGTFLQFYGIWLLHPGSQDNTSSATKGQNITKCVLL